MSVILSTCRPLSDLLCSDVGCKTLFLQQLVSLSLSLSLSLSPSLSLSLSLSLFDESLTSASVELLWWQNSV
jgi:hypothetical protein